MTTLQQKVTELVSRWEGSDAAQRLTSRQQFIEGLTALVESELVLKMALAAAEAPAPILNETKAA